MRVENVFLYSPSEGIIRVHHGENSRKDQEGGKGFSPCSLFTSVGFKGINCQSFFCKIVYENKKIILVKIKNKWELKAVTAVKVAESQERQNFPN